MKNPANIQHSYFKSEKEIRPLLIEKFVKILLYIQDEVFILQ